MIYFKLMFKYILEFLSTKGGELILASIIIPLLIWLGKTLKQEYLDYKKGKKLIAEKEDEIHYLDSLRAVADGYSSMQKLEDHPLIERVLLLEISNGGSRPKPGGRVYANAVEIKLDKHHTKFSREELLNRYKGVELDENYIYMVIESENKGVYKFHTEQEREGLLKSLYINEGIKYSEIYHIHTDAKKDKMFILSVSTHKDKEEFMDEKLSALIVSEITVIKTAFKNYR